MAAFSKCTQIDSRRRLCHFRRLVSRFLFHGPTTSMLSFRPERTPEKKVTRFNRRTRRTDAKSYSARVSVASIAEPGDGSLDAASPGAAQGRRALGQAANPAGVLRIARLSGNFEAGMAAPMPALTTPLRAALKHGFRVWSLNSGFRNSQQHTDRYQSCEVRERVDSRLKVRVPLGSSVEFRAGQPIDHIRIFA